MEKDRDADAAQTQLPRWDGPLTHPFYSKVLKRCLDFSLAVVFLLPCLAVMLPIAIAVKCTSEGPVFYRALRGGYHNRPFSILKFRTMVVGADQYASTTALDDPRVTRVGRVLRRSKLDELPQLFNILKGEMSFIGPRPELLRYTMRYTPQEQCILWVRPGISDPSSIRLINLDELVGHDDRKAATKQRFLPRRTACAWLTRAASPSGWMPKVFWETLLCVLKKNLNREPSVRRKMPARQGGNR